MAREIAEGTPFGRQHRQRPARLHGHLGQEFGTHFQRNCQAVADVLVALTADLTIHRDHNRRAFGGFGAVNQPFVEGAVLADVKLEPEGCRRGLCHVFDRADADG